MSKVELYEEMDKMMEKEKNKKEERNITKEKPQISNLKGGEGFVCSLECKTCGATS